MKIILYSIGWNYAGVETRAYRFYTNLKKYKFTNSDVNVKLYVISESGRKSVHSPKMPGVCFISRKDFLQVTKELTKKDVLIMFVTGENIYDKKVINSNEKSLPLYFEFFENNANKGLYIFGHYATKFCPFFKELVEYSDFILSSFLVSETTDKFYIKDFSNKRKDGKEIWFKKPIWWFNILLSPFEKKYVLKKIKDKNFSYKNKKRIVYTGRVTFEKDIDNIIRNFISLSKSKKNFILDIYGNDDNSRQIFFLKQKYGNIVDKFLRGKYNAFLHSKKILYDANIGVNLRKKIVEENFVIENTVLEYITYGVVPLINENFKSKKNFSIPLITLDLNENNSIEQLILENYNKNMDDIRLNNLRHLLLYNDGKKIIKDFYDFLYNYNFIK